MKKGYIICSSDGLLFRDRKHPDIWWRGGGKSLVYVPVFDTRERAYTILRKIRREWKDKEYASNWYQVLEVEWVKG